MGGRSKNRRRGGSGRSKSSERWLARQRKDPFARKAAETGKASRAHFKLEQLDQRFRLLRRGMQVLELGAAPGGWTNYVEEQIAPGGRLIAVDNRPVTIGAATVLIEGLYGDEEVDNKISELLGGEALDLVLSDMAPNISGIRAADQARSMALAELAEGAADRWLKRGGALVVKTFQGAGVEDWIRRIRGNYKTFKQVKPEASRPDSREMYAVAQGFKGRR
ncbi:MAG: RlmE family RNA methyltransferase [Pseudomonadota bacterium]